MQTDSQNNPWLNIPIDDYEKHMSHSSVGQLGLLNSLTKKYLKKINPAIAVFLGVAGGNGLEHIDNDITKEVIGIDINQKYVDVCHRRYHNIIPTLKLLHLDITIHTSCMSKADFIWAGLVLEYTGIEKCLQFCVNNISPGGHFIATIQRNNNLNSVRSTGIQSVKKAGLLFCMVDPDVMQEKAEKMGLLCISKEENQLPNGKSFQTFDFLYL